LRRAQLRLSDSTHSNNQVSREAQKPRAEKIEPSFLKAAKQGLYFLVRCKFAAFDLRESVENS
jgi:hypothetical protein